MFSLIFVLVGCNGAIISPPPSRELPPAAITPTQPAAPPTRELPNQTAAPTAPSVVGAPAAFKKFLSNVQVSIEGDSIVLKTNGVPPHPSPYFPRGDSNYQAYNGSNPNYRQNPNQIRGQNIAFMLPREPRKADRHAPTPLGPIGIALDGVPLFNQYAGPNQPLTFEINSFDQFNGHPQQEGMYHYHIEPLFLTQKFGKETLVGFLLDGFPVYGSFESGKLIANKDLDEFHGHAHATQDYPGGIYHYHITSDVPYINGSGFYGTAGRVNFTR